MSERPRLINIAYRLLVSLAEAEDVVQEAYARWYSMPSEKREDVDSPGAWLTTVVTRICLDQLRSARARRESYVGEWLPEPLPDRSEWVGGHDGGGGDDPADRVTLDESVSMAFLVVLESMTPAERVAFVLHDVFRYSFADVSDILGRTPAACRQLAFSARRRVRATTRSTQVVDTQAGVIHAFKEAWDAKDIDALVKLLDPQAVASADSGGRVRAADRPLVGARQIADHLVHEVAGDRALSLLERTVNGQPGLVAQLEGVTVAVFAFDVAQDRIQRVWAVRNPAKLGGWMAR